MQQAFKQYLALLFFFLEFTISAQSPIPVFTRMFGDSLSESSFSAIQTNDGGYILSGFTNSYTTRDDDYYLIKTDSLAHVTWSKIYSGAYSDQAYSVQQTSDGGYILA